MRSESFPRSRLIPRTRASLRSAFRRADAWVVGLLALAVFWPSFLGDAWWHVTVRFERWIELAQRAIR